MAPKDNSSNSSEPGAEFANDKLAKKELVVKTISDKCSSSSQHEIFSMIHDKINDVSGDGSKLTATILSGGITNYSYKVYVDNHPDLCLFAKLSFDFALWNPDAHHDLKRTDNEYEIMKKMSSKMPDCVVAPMACWDIDCEGGQRAKLLLTEWSSADEQLGNQFADGLVDPRIAPKIADTLSALHTITDFDQDFNENVKPAIVGLIEMVKGATVETSKKTDPKNRTEAYCTELGSDGIDKILSANIENFHQRDCLIHSDSHVFNMLVEAKPSIEKLQEFGPDGKVVLCDWEMTMAGPIGRDVGLALAGPIGCLVGHALNSGRSEESIQNYVDTLLDRYCSNMIEAGKTEEEMAKIVQNVAGWVGWCQYIVFYFLGVQLDAFGVESEELQSYMRDSMGILGLKLMHFSYGTDQLTVSKDLKEVLKTFTALYSSEVSRAIFHCATRGRKMQPRKSSILRASNRRVSDAAMHLLATDSVARKLSIGDDVSVENSLKEINNVMREEAKPLSQ
jgi:thiamine kinase-like enzyme